MGCFGPDLPALPRSVLPFEDSAVKTEAEVEEFVKNWKALLVPLLDESVGSGNPARRAECWETLKTPPGLTARAANVEGLLEKVMGMSIITEGPVNSSQLFAYLTSKEGFQLLDPDTTNHADGVVETLPWSRPGGRAEVTYALQPLSFPFSGRTMMVLNTVDQASELFLSVSVLHDSHTKEADAAKGFIRADVAWAMDTKQLPDGRCELRILFWFTMRGTVPVMISNGYTTSIYPNGLHKRLSAFLATKPTLPPVPSFPTEAEKAAVAAGGAGASEKIAVSMMA